ncbi:MAG: ROK family protein [Acidimicrobiales bacterium]
MARGDVKGDERILAIDVGATTIKFCPVDAGGLLAAVRRRRTPYPCEPARLTALLAQRITTSGLAQVGVGFPGQIHGGVVIDPGNLSRPGGIGSAIDAELDGLWRGFPLEEVLRSSTDRDVRVVNDASLAALGCCTGVGVELVLTLGTGLGLALEIDGQLRAIRDVGAEVCVGGRTYDEALGERARAQNEAQWRSSVAEAILGFAREFQPTTLHLAGGNAKRLSPRFVPELSCPIAIHGNDAPLRGAEKLFYP